MGQFELLLGQFELLLYFPQNARGKGVTALLAAPAHVKRAVKVTIGPDFQGISIDDTPLKCSRVDQLQFAAVASTTAELLQRNIVHTTMNITLM